MPSPAPGKSTSHRLSSTYHPVSYDAACLEPTHAAVLGNFKGDDDARAYAALFNSHCTVAATIAETGTFARSLVLAKKQFMYRRSPRAAFPTTECHEYFVVAFLRAAPAQSGVLPPIPVFFRMSVDLA